MTRDRARKSWPRAFANKSGLIVGASSGIGRVVALRMAESGARVALTARRREKFELLRDEIVKAGGICHLIAAVRERCGQRCEDAHARAASRAPGLRGVDRRDPVRRPSFVAAAEVD